MSHESIDTMPSEANLVGSMTMPAPIMLSDVSNVS